MTNQERNDYIYDKLKEKWKGTFILSCLIQHEEKLMDYYDKRDRRMYTIHRSNYEELLELRRNI